MMIVFGILGQIWVTPGWADDPVRRQDRRRQMGGWDIGWQKGRVGRVQ